MKYLLPLGLTLLLGCQNQPISLEKEVLNYNRGKTYNSGVFKDGEWLTYAKESQKGFEIDGFFERDGKRCFFKINPDITTHNGALSENPGLCDFHREETEELAVLIANFYK